MNYCFSCIVKLFSDLDQSCHFELSRHLFGGMNIELVAQVTNSLDEYINRHHKLELILIWIPKVT